MVNAKAIGLVALLVIGLSSGIGGYLGSQYVDDQLQQGIEDAVKIPTEGSEGYSEFISNEDADTPTFRKYYFWNLTNSEAYLNGADPVYQEIGPYVYQEFKVKFNVEFNSDNSQVSYQTYTYYEFSRDQSFTGASTADKIVNINPAYQGVIDAAGSEQALVISFVGPTISSIVDGLTGDFTAGVVAQGDAAAMEQIEAGLNGDFLTGVGLQGQAEVMNTIVDGLTGDFTDGVIYQGSAQALEGIENEAVENFEFQINATTAANVIKGNYDLAGDVNTANAALFNSTNFSSTFQIQGVSEWATDGLASLAYSNDTVTAFLYNNPFGAPAVFDDLATGTGVLAYLELYNNATNELGGLDNSTLQAAYGASQTQLDAFAGYLNSYLIENNTVIAQAYAGSNGGQTTQEGAFTNLYTQWVNGTFVPAGLDINGDGDGDDGFELSLTGGYGISNATVTAFFDSSNPLALTNADQGIFAWLQAANGNTTLQTTLATTYGLNTTELVAIFTWLGEFVDFDTGLGAVLTLTEIAVTSGLAPGSIDDGNLGYLHWASSNVTGGVTLNQVDSSVPVAPEFWAATGVELSLDNAEALLSNAALNLTNVNGTGLFFQEGQKVLAGNTTALGYLNTVFSTSLNATEVGLIMDYLANYPITDVFLLGALADATGEAFGSFTYEQVGYLHWANSQVAGGATLNDLGAGLPVSPELWVYSSSNFSVSHAIALFETANYNITSTQGVGFLLQEGQKAVAGNATALATINAVYGVTFTTNQLVTVLGYLSDVITDVFVLPQISFSTGEAGIEVSDLGFLHFANPGVTGGATLIDLGSELPGSVALWDNTDEQLSLDDAKALLTNDTGLSLTTTEGVVSYLTIAAQLQTAPATALDNINATFGAELNITQAAAVASYLSYIQETFVIAGTLQPIFDQGGGLVTARSVTDWLFEAEDPFLEFLKANGQDIESTNVALFSNPDGIDDPSIPPASTINTGQTDIDEVNQYIEWQGQSSITVWESDETIEGTDATQFAPGVSSDDTLKAFVSDLLRVIDFTYEEDVNVNGIEAYKYVIPEDVLDVSSNYHQTIKGLANMTAAAGINLFLSKPHFLDADSSLASAVSGLSANADAHDTYLNVEPLTGAVIDARKRLQINLQTGPGDLLTAGISESKMMPIVWVEDGGTIPEDSAQSFIETIYGAQQTSQAISLYGLIGGGVLATIAVFSMLRPKFGA